MVVRVVLEHLHEQTVVLGHEEKDCRIIDLGADSHVVAVVIPDVHGVPARDVQSGVHMVSVHHYSAGSGGLGGRVHDTRVAVPAP